MKFLNPNLNNVLVSLNLAFELLAPKITDINLVSLIEADAAKQ